MIAKIGPEDSRMRARTMSGWVKCTLTTPNAKLLSLHVADLHRTLPSLVFHSLKCLVLGPNIPRATHVVEGLMQHGCGLNWATKLVASLVTHTATIVCCALGAYGTAAVLLVVRDSGRATKTHLA